MLHYNRSEIKAWAKSRIPLLWNRRYVIAASVAGLVALYFFRGLLAMVAVMAAFIVLGVLSMMYNRWVKVSLGVELIMLGMVIVSSVYGMVPGIVVGCVAIFFAEVLTDRFTYSTFVSFIGVFAVAAAVPHLSGMSITWIGIWMTVLYDLIIGPGYIIMGSSIWRTLLFIATHLLFNTWVFVFIAPMVHRVIA